MFLLNLSIPSPWICVGNKVEKLCDLCNITVNKNAVFGDSSALAPGGVRIGKNIPLRDLLASGCKALKSGSSLLEFKLFYFSEFVFYEAKEGWL